MSHDSQLSVQEPGADSLSRQEQEALDLAEEIIDRGLHTFLEVGTALTAIKEGELYRTTHATFDSYCEDRWDMKERYTRYVLAAAEVVDTLKRHNCTILPANEGQARPLTTIDMTQVNDVWEEVIEKAPRVNDKPKITGRLVEDVVRQWKAADEPYVEPAEPIVDDKPEDDEEDFEDDPFDSDPIWKGVKDNVLIWANKRKDDNGYGRAVMLLRLLIRRIEELDE